MFFASKWQLILALFEVVEFHSPPLGLCDDWLTGVFGVWHSGFGFRFGFGRRSSSCIWQRGMHVRITSPVQFGPS